MSEEQQPPLDPTIAVRPVGRSQALDLREQLLVAPGESGCWVNRFLYQPYRAVRVAVPSRK
jgi:hypothetical protein